MRHGRSDSWSALHLGFVRVRRFQHAQRVSTNRGQTRHVFIQSSQDGEFSHFHNLSTSMILIFCTFRTRLWDPPSVLEAWDVPWCCVYKQFLGEGELCKPFSYRLVLSCAVRCGAHARALQFLEMEFVEAPSSWCSCISWSCCAMSDIFGYLWLMLYPLALAEFPVILKNLKRHTCTSRLLKQFKGLQKTQYSIFSWILREYMAPDNRENQEELYYFRRDIGFTEKIAWLSWCQFDLFVSLILRGYRREGHRSWRLPSWGAGLRAFANDIPRIGPLRERFIYCKMKMKHMEHHRTQWQTMTCDMIMACYVFEYLSIFVTCTTHVLQCDT